MGILSREGADFGGYWRIILSYHFEGMRRSTLRLYNWRPKWMPANILVNEEKFGE